MNSVDNIIEFKQKELPLSINRIGWILFGLGLLLSILAFIYDKQRSSFNLLIVFMFLMSIGVGSLFLVALEYIGGAVWSTPFRRISEFLSSILLILPVFAIPLLFNMQDLYHWTHIEAVQNDKVLQAKSPYLNTNFFLVRTIVFFGLWYLFYWLITKNSKLQDTTKDQNLTTKNVKIAAVFMPVFAITISFSSIDWMMSLEPHWYSTIFGVYYFSGTILAALAALTIIVVLLKENGYLHPSLIKDNYYSLGALLFAFINFWAYIAFSQFMLIWYANIPEETVWILARWHGSWKFISLGLIIVHFIVPYAALLSQPSKMNPTRLLWVSIWILFAHLFDLYWIIMPTFSSTGAVFSWIEIAFPILVIGAVILLFYYKAKSNNIIPIGDPKLKRGLDFRL
ncbi:MAG: quinol:cytochrome C oxidoreductase [Ignavibacteriales bacterium]|nr:quinol:cytochrome C oxidoreductase [Ignavibacteriales bacterium]